MPTNAIKEEKTLMESWNGKKPNVGYFQVFGCGAYVHIPDSERRKLDSKVEKLIFVSYSNKMNGFRLYDSKSHRVLTR